MALLILLVVSAIALGVGARALRGLGLEEEPAPDRACFALGIGLGCTAYGVLALGLVRQLAPIPVGVLLLGLAALGARPGLALAREGAASLRRRGAGGSALAAVTGGALAFLLLLALAAALAPPSGGDWDGLSYHLADPAIYIRRRGIVYLFWESHSNFPFTVEMLYAIGLLLKSPEGARLFHWLYLALACLTLASAWRRLWPDAPPGARWLAPLLLAATPMLFWCATVAYIDLALMAYTLLALYATWLWARTARGGWLWASGICLGLALGVKMTGGLTALLLAPVVLVIGWRAGAAVRSLLAWGGIAAAVAAPWYIKSYLYTGNPVYPFFYHLFPQTRYWNAGIAATYAEHQAGFGLGRGLRHLLAAPWDLVAHPDRFSDGPASFQILFESTGPALLALAPAVLLLRRRDPLAWGMLLFTAVYGLIWFHLTQQTRYLVPVFPLLALVGARGLCGLGVGSAAREGPARERTRPGAPARRERRARSGTRRAPAGPPVAAQEPPMKPGGDGLGIARLAGAGTVGITVAAVLLSGLLIVEPALPVVLGRESREAYLSRTLDVYPVCAYANAALPPDARVMLIHEVRGLYLERDYLWGNEGHHARIPWQEFADEAEMRRFLRRELGVTHVLINHHILAKDARPGKGSWERTLWEAIHAGTLAPEYEARGFSLHALAGE
ncbi:MAG: DUF2029 domain-containing protein [Armatimonadetes bacterium]|nr:DUF2029 domain-containing protein [Armatimonadota bacterium]